MPRRNRFKIAFAVYLIPRKGDEVLLSLRQGTGWKDGWYSLVAGHVDGGEAAELAMAREAKEEAGIDIDVNQLKHIFTLHRTHEDPQEEYVDLFFEVSQWTGEIINAEPEKCGGLEWVNIHELPENTLDYVKFVIANYPKGLTYSSMERK